MSELTFSRRLQQLITQLEYHPHRDELLCLMAEQLNDDTDTVYEDLG